MSPASVCCLRNCSRRPTRSTRSRSGVRSACGAAAAAGLFVQRLGQLRTADVYAFPLCDLGAQPGDRLVAPVRHPSMTKGRPLFENFDAQTSLAVDSQHMLKPTLIPIVVIAFNRPGYLRRTLISLRAQRGADVVGRRVLLFQDGAVNPYSGRRGAEDTQIAESIAVFHEFFPSGEIHASPVNLGVGLNFERAENKVFCELNVPIAYFFEDDLELGPYYVTTMDRLATLAMSHDKIGYFAAYGDRRLPLEEQRRRASELQALDHNWAFGLTQRQWRRSSPYVEQYLKLIRGKDYRDRSIADIVELFHSWGMGAAATSQDSSKGLACLRTGGLRINTVACFGRYIGAEGEHTNPTIFRQMGFDTTAVVEENLFALDKLDAAQLASIKAKLTVFSKTNVPHLLQMAQAEKEARERNGSSAGWSVDAPRQYLVNRFWRGIDPFSGIVASPSEFDMQGWGGSKHPWLEETIRTLRPKIVIEVGAWKGASVIHMADCMRRSQVPGLVIAVDTWLGSAEHWLNDEWFQGLRIDSGRQTIQRTFMNNVVHLDLQNYILPMPLNSVGAAHLMREVGLKADIIHLDAAHDEQSVSTDLAEWWPILREGGTLIGDDYYPDGRTWPGVRAAFDAFVKQSGQSYEHSLPKIKITKTAALRTSLAPSDADGLPEVLEYTGEFGPELILSVPAIRWLSQEGLLKNHRIKTYKGMRCFYDDINCLEVIEKNEPRVYVPAQKRASWLPVKNEHDFDGQSRPTRHLYPDLRQKFCDIPLPDIEGLTSSLIIIHNKHNDEWGIGPVNHIPLDTLDASLRTLKQHFSVVYIRHGIAPRDPGLSEDHNTSQTFGDREILNKYPEVLCFDDIYATYRRNGGDRDINTFKSALYSRCYRFISSQGGGAAQIAFYSGSLLVVLHKNGQEENWAYSNGYYGFVARVPPILAICRNETDLRRSLSLFDGTKVVGERIWLAPGSESLLTSLSPETIAKRR